MLPGPWAAALATFQAVWAALLASPATGNAVKTFCAERLADYKVPERYTLREEPLPRNANGKVLKRQLKGESA